MMRKIFFIGLLIFSIEGAAKTYTGAHFSVISDLNPAYVEILQRNLEGYYENLVNQYFVNGWTEPLKIYYFESQADTRKYLKNDSISYGIYYSSIPAVFTHRVMDEGGLAGLGTLFHEVTHHFVRLNFKNPPSWFNEGLTCFLSEQTRLVNGKINLGHPNPWREQKLRNMIEQGYEIDVAKCVSLTSEEFYEDKDNYHPLRALFYWLYAEDFLKSYIQNVQKQGYRLSVLEQTTGKSAEQINRELLDFIHVYCYAGAYYMDGVGSKDSEDKISCLNKALALYPEYRKAQYELAWNYFVSGQDELFTDKVTPVLQDSECIEYKDAWLLMGKYYGKQKQTEESLQAFQEAYQYSFYDEYQYQLLFQIGYCYTLLGNREEASRWYSLFLEQNWEPQRLAKWCAYAQKYLGRS